MISGIVYCFVKSYLAIFGAYISSFNIKEEVVYERLSWIDENSYQDFSWEINYNTKTLFKP